MLRVARRIVPQTFFDVIPEQVDLSLSEHDDLLSAMLARNGNLARAIAEKHFLAAGKLLAQRHTLLLHLELEGQEHQEAMSTKGAA
jgi:DNA-binding GntR family transcriptional regulator